jgi:hypothetical protein
MRQGKSRADAPNLTVGLDSKGNHVLVEAAAGELILSERKNEQNK